MLAVNEGARIDPTLDRGVFLLSLDTEMAWGDVRRSTPDPRARLYDGTRYAVRHLLALLERYGVRATWAVVGHLFLDSCEMVGGLKHPEVERAAYPWHAGDWFDADPCSDVQSAPAWYAPDLIDWILECPAPQEIGCHTFSHILVDDPGCSRGCFRSELRACRALAERRGLELRSFVFPRNGIAHLDVLKEEGFLAYRGNIEPPWTRFVPGGLRRPARLVRWAAPLFPLTAQPQRVGGLWNLPATTFFLHSIGVARAVPIRARVVRAVRGIQRSIEERSISHLYLHPFNLASDPNGLLRGLEQVLATVARHRDAGRIDNPTMGELAEALSRRSVTAEVGGR
jgi:peptidoglycan/xylan/chitin deacetylase (PgdA/CDA1 family)